MSLVVGKLIQKLLISGLKMGNAGSLTFLSVHGERFWKITSCYRRDLMAPEHRQEIKIGRACI